MTDKKAKTKMYMNVNTRSVHFFKPSHLENPDMVPYFGELPPIHPTLGQCIVPKEELGPAFSEVTSDVEMKPPIKNIVPDLTEKINEEEKEFEDKIEKIAAVVDDLKAFDFTSAGIPKVDKLSLAVGFPVTGPERDHAYALYLEAKSIED